MALNYPGGYVTKSPPTPTSTSAPGIWTMDQALQYIKAGTWPTPPIGDQYFQYTNLLLGTGSTNGAQNNTFLDSSSNNFTITRNGNTSQGTFSPFSQADGYWSNYFDGTGDNFTVPNSSNFAFGTGDFTVECWVYWSYTQYNAIVSTSTTAQNSGSWILGYSNTANSMGFCYDVPGFNFIEANFSGFHNQWTHVAVTRSGTSLRLFFNGTQVASATNSTNFSYTSGNVKIGQRWSDQDAYTTTGYLSNLRVVKGTAVYTAAFTPPTAPLSDISGTSLLFATSNRFRDASANAVAVTVNGNPAVVPFQPFGAPTSPYNTTNVGGSGYFDGSGDALLINDSSQFTLGTNNFTVEAWVYPTTTGVQRIISGQSNSAASGSTISYWLDIDSSNQPRILIWSGGTDYTATSSVAVSRNQWVHLAGVRNGNTLTIYVNGTSTGTVSVTGVTVNDSTNQVGIGQLGEHTNVPWSGFISSFRLVNGTAVYTSNFTPPTAPLTAITNTALLTNFTNAAIFDNAAKNDMETVGNAQVSTSVAKFGNSVSFDGNGDRLFARQSNIYDFGTGEFTIECWVYFNTVSNSQQCMVSGYVSPNGWNFQFRTDQGISPGCLHFAAGDTTILNSSGLTLSTATWYHVAVVRCGSTIKLYLNGNTVGSVVYTSAVNTANNLLVGALTDSVSQLDGYISNLRITKGVGRYPYNFTPPTQAFGTIYRDFGTPAADPYFEYTTLLLPGSGTNGAQNNTFLDSSTNAFSITRNGNTTQGTFSPFSQTGWSNYFDGTGDYLSVPDNAAFDLGNGAFTLEAWIYPNDVTPSKAEWILSQWQSDSQNSWGFRIETSGALYFYYSADGNNATVFGADSPGIGERQWNHIAVVRNSNTVTIYVNGSAVSSATVTATFFNSSASVMVGNQANTGLGQTFTGYISNARVVKGTAVYTAAFTPPTSALTAISGTSLLTCQSNRFVDNSANAFAITVNGNTSVQAFSPFNPTAAYSAATNGGSGYFDGNGDYLQIANNSAIDAGTGAFTYECWFYPTASKHHFVLAANGTGSGFHVDVNGDYVQLGRNNVAEDVQTAAGTIILNQWHHIVVARNSSNNLAIFINGTRQAYNASNTNDYGLGGHPLAIGTGENNNSTTWVQGFLNGSAVYKSAQYDPTQTTITVPTAPKTAGTSGLLVNYTNAGITDATAKNDFETVGNAQISNGQAKWGSTSIYFDGSGGDAILTPMSQNLQLLGQDWTIEYWLYANSWTTGDIIGSWKSGAYSWIIQMNGSGVTMYNTLATSYSFSTTLSTGQWYHVALSNYGLRLRCFINGNQIGSTQTITAFPTATRPLYIGYNEDNGGGAAGYNGYLQDVRITTGIARYTQNFTPPTAAFQLL